MYGYSYTSIVESSIEKYLLYILGYGHIYYYYYRYIGPLYSPNLRSTAEHDLIYIYKLLFLMIAILYEPSGTFFCPSYLYIRILFCWLQKISIKTSI